LEESPVPCTDIRSRKVVFLSSLKGMESPLSLWIKYIGVPCSSTSTSYYNTPAEAKAKVEQISSAVQTDLQENQHLQSSRKYLNEILPRDSELPTTHQAAH